MSTTSPQKQLSLTEAFETAQDAAESAESQPTRQEDRVVEDALTCHCGRPAGADGLCTAHRGDYAGETIGSGGRRL